MKEEMHPTTTIARPAATSTTAAAGGSEPRQCWECLRRRWVCDAARPVCNKCRAAGIVCPGYNDQKPLTWLAPGRVTSRTRRQHQRQPNRRRNKPSSPPTKSTTARKGVASNGADDKNGARPKADEPAKETDEPAREADEKDGSQAALSSAIVPTGTATGTGTGTGTGRNGADRERGLSGNTALLPKIANAVKLRTDTCDVVEALQYYNSHVYPTLISNQLAPNPFVVPVVAVHSFPTSMRHALVSMALSHRILQLRRSRGQRRSHGSNPNSPDSNSSPSPPSQDFISASTMAEISEWHAANGLGGSAAAPETTVAVSTTAAKDSTLSIMSWRLHHHTGLAIRALNEEIDKESTRSSDATIISVLVFLIAELQQSVSPHWRPHVDGLTALITLRGGLGNLIESAAHLRPALLSFTIVAVIANTTSPPSDQITATTHLQLIDMVSTLYSIGVFPSLPCPQSLFLEIIHINYLRSQATSNLTSLPNDASGAAASAVLDRIDAFDPESWLQSSSLSSHANEGLLIARIFQSTVALFALSSLQWVWNFTSTTSPHTTSPNTGLRVMRSNHRVRLFTLLETAMESDVVKKTVTWPLVVAGVVAAAGTQDERKFVERHLSEMSRDTGNSPPLVAIGILEKFWASGKTEWDDCFDRPYAFLT